MRPHALPRHAPRACPPSRRAVTATASAPVPTAARIADTGPAVAARAAGAPLLAVPGGRRARLVSPGDAPLAVDVDLFPAGAPASPSTPPPPASASVHTVVYVLGGAGTLTSATGPPVALRAGDCAAARGGAVLAPAPNSVFDLNGVPHALAAITITLPADTSVAAAAAVEAAAAGRVAGANPSGTLSGRDAKAACSAASAVQQDECVLRDDDDGAASMPPIAASRPPPAAAIVRHLADLPAFQMPSGTNRIALAFDPARSGVPFCAGVEVFSPAHVTPRHSHAGGYELFFVLRGAGRAHCGDASFDFNVGDVAIFPPHSWHGLDAVAGDGAGEEPLVCLELMAPDDRFGEAVRSGVLTGTLTDSELCALAAVGCGSGGG